MLLACGAAAAATGEDPRPDRAPLVFEPRAPGATGAYPDLPYRFPAPHSHGTTLPLLSEAPNSGATGLRPARRTRLDWETGEGRSYAVPALGIFGFDFLLNQFDRHAFEHDTYDTDLHSIRRNLHSSWVFDNDPYTINQFGHPYQGSMYHGFARSAGLDFWTSLGYTFGGSVLWEIAGETTPPSKNDQIASGIGGSFFGEPLFRMANLLLEDGDLPRFWRELGAAAISPSTGFNRWAFGDRFKTVFPSHHPAYFARLSLGADIATRSQRGVSQAPETHQGIADFSMDYGVPGKRDYVYRRPFDYFHFRFTASSGANKGVENVTSRGLLLGSDYGGGGKAYSGVWGLYGSYDYIAPQVFRASSVALSLGSTAQAVLSRSIAVQGTALLGLGYGAAGTIRGMGERDYHYGLTPQALLAARFVFGARMALDLALRDYYVSRVASTEARGSENVARAEASFIYRIHRRHAVSLRYVYSERRAHYPDLGSRNQSRATIGVFYTYLFGNTHFGTNLP